MLSKKLPLNGNTSQLLEFATSSLKVLWLALMKGSEKFVCKNFSQTMNDFTLTEIK